MHFVTEFIKPREDMRYRSVMFRDIYDESVLKLM